MNEDLISFNNYINIFDDVYNFAINLKERFGEREKQNRSILFSSK